MLVTASPFFAAALNGNFSEASDKKVELPEENPQTFEAFANWLYHPDQDISEMEAFQVPGNKWRCIIDLYIFADKVQCPAVGNRVNKDIFAHMMVHKKEGFLPRNEDITRLWSAFPKSCGLCRMLVDIITWTLNDESFEQMRSNYVSSPELGWELVDSLWYRAKGKRENTFRNRTSNAMPDKYLDKDRGETARTVQADL